MTGIVAATPVLARSLHDRIGWRRSDEQWLREAWADQRSRVLVLSADGKVATVAGEGGSPTPAGGESARAELTLAYSAPAQVSETGVRVLLGEHAGVAYFAVLAEPQVAGADWRDLRSLAVQLGALESGLLTAAVAMQSWHASHTHCPQCGSATEPIQAGWARRCLRDDSLHFPRTDPAVIMLVTDDAGRCLLGRSAVWPPGRFSTLAGFVEAGESAEAAVAREVAEEVGVAVTDVRYYASQPHPFPASLMLGFTARLAGDPTLQVDNDEIAEAGWFTREEVRQTVEWGQAGDETALLRALPPQMSIARQLIESWLNAG